MSELDRGEAHTAAGAKHDELVACAHPGGRAQRVIRRAVGEPERGGGVFVDVVGNPPQLGRPDYHLACEFAVDPGSGDPVTNCETACTVGGFVDDTGEFTA